MPNAFQAGSYLAAVGVYLMLVALGSATIQWNYFLPSINSITADNQVLLTFDDGPDEHYTPLILDILQQSQIKAVFFLIGSKVVQYPDIVQRIHQEGHLIGNHTTSHSNSLPWANTAKLQQDITECAKVIAQVTGSTPRLFRPPFGVTTPRYARVIKRLGLQSIGWSIRSLDTTITEESKLLQRILHQVRGRDIVLLHDTQEVTMKVLPQIIQQISNKGYTFALPEDCFKERVYEA